MILPADRKLARRLVSVNAFYVERNLFGTPQICARWGFGWLLKMMRNRQTSDGLHHAPACPGNEWDGQMLVFQRCNCGAEGQP